MFEIEVISNAPGVAASGDGVVGREGTPLSILPVPISRVFAPLADIDIVLSPIAVGLRAVGLDGVLRIARLHAEGAAKVPHGYGSHGDSVRVVSEHGAGNSVIRGDKWDKSCYSSEKGWELHYKEMDGKGVDNLNETLMFACLV